MSERKDNTDEPIIADDDEANKTDSGASDPETLFKEWSAGDGSPADGEEAADDTEQKGGDRGKAKGKEDDDKGDDKNTPWFMKKDEPERPRYVRPPEPDRALSPHKPTPKVKFYAKRPPRVLITPDAYKRMCLYVEIGQKEVGWLGTVIRLKNGDFLIQKTFLLEQEVTATETELNTESQERLVLELLEKGDEGFEESNRLRFWGHSHVRMATFPSGTDESTMDRIYEDGYPWYVRGIFNKKGHATFCIFLYEEGLRIDDVPWFVVDPADGRTILQHEEVKPWNRRWKRKPKPPIAPGQSERDYTDLWSWRNTSWELEDETPELPKELEIDDALRAEVQAEFDARVNERSFFGGSGGGFWNTLFGDDEDSKEDADSTDGDSDNPAKEDADAADSSGSTSNLVNRPRKRRRRKGRNRNDRPAQHENTAQDGDDKAPPEDMC